MKKKRLVTGNKLSSQVLLLQGLNPEPLCWVGGTTSGSSLVQKPAKLTDDVKQKQNSQETIKQQPNPSTRYGNKEKISQVFTPSYTPTSLLPRDFNDDISKKSSLPFQPLHRKF